VVLDFKVPKEEGDPGCFNASVFVRKVFMSEAFCDLGANGNLMLLSTFDRIRGLTLCPCFMDIGLVDGEKSTPSKMVRDMMIAIEGFKFKINVIVSKNKKKHNCPLILGWSFLATDKTLIYLKQKEVFIRSNRYYQCYKVNPSSSNAYNEGIKVADTWEMFKEIIEHSTWPELE